MPSHDEHPEHAIFFLTGHVRSGTNWVANLLNLHPQINLQGEYHLQVIHDAVQQLMATDYSQVHYDPVKAEVRDAFEQMVRRAILALVPRKPEAYWVGDRSPRPLVPLIPGCPHIVSMRDGRDVLVSWTFHELRHGGPKTEPFYTHMRDDIDAFQRDPDHFRKHPERLLADPDWVRSLSESWRDRVAHDMAMISRIEAGDVDARAMLMKYEDVHADPRAAQASMYRFLNLDPDEADTPSVESNTAAGFDREDPNSLYRKGKIGDWQTYATDAWVNQFNDIAGDAMVAAGYA